VTVRADWQGIRIGLELGRLAEAGCPPGLASRLAAARTGAAAAGRPSEAKPAGRPAAPAPDRRRTTREYAHGVACPRCGAHPGRPCQGKRGDRSAAHAERHHQALAEGAPRAKPSTSLADRPSGGAVSPEGRPQAEREALDTVTTVGHVPAHGPAAGPARS